MRNRKIGFSRTRRADTHGDIVGSNQLDIASLGKILRPDLAPGPDTPQNVLIDILQRVEKMGVVDRTKRRRVIAKQNRQLSAVDVTGLQRS